MNRIAVMIVLSLASLSAAVAAPITTEAFSGAYTAVTTSTGAGTPTINASSNTSLYLPSSFSGTLTQGQTTPAQNFLLVSPTQGSGLVTGSILVDFSFTDAFGSAVTGVSNTPGANTASLVNGMIQFDGNYAINYAAQTDCITWAGSCTPANQAGAVKTQLSNTILVSFADGSALDLNLYDWSDWDMQPQISFDLVSGPQSVPEPASLAVLGAGLAGLAFAKRRRAMSI